MGPSRKPDRPEQGGAAGGRAWSRPPEDLAGDRVLRNCAQTPFEGVSRPSIGPYVILSRLGQGGMGVVFLAAHTRLASEVAIKVLPVGAEQQLQGARERFEREAKIAARVKSDHLVRVLDVDEDPASGSRFIVMEYVNGRAADAWADGRRSRGSVSEADALDVCIAATRGLADAHATSILHRDVKPGNVLIPDGRDGRPDLRRAKLADLGLAREEAHGATLTGTGTGLGTPGYMAPEQLRDAKRAGRAADVFSMGATVYALLTGSAPFEGATVADAMLRTIAGDYPPLASRRPGTSEATVALVATCLSADPGARFASAAALLRALETARSALDAKTASSPETVARVKSFAGVAAGDGGATEPVAAASRRAVWRRPAVAAAAVVAVAAIA